MKQKYIILLVLGIVFVIFGACAYFYSNNNGNSFDNLSKEKMELLTKEYSLIAGNKDAKVTIVEFMDPSCGTCIYFAPIIKNILKKYDGKVRVAYRFLPLHQGSDFILSLVEAANEQDKFQESLDMFLENTKRLYTNNGVNAFIAWGILQELDIDIEKVQNFLKNNDNKLRMQFDQNMQDALSLGVTGTPTFFVNGVMLEKLSEEDLIKLVEEQIKKVY